MLDIFGGENWTPDADHPGRLRSSGPASTAGRPGRWDPEGETPDGLEGNFVEGSEISFDDDALRLALRRRGPAEPAAPT